MIWYCLQISRKQSSLFVFLWWRHVVYIFAAILNLKTKKCAIAEKKHICRLWRFYGYLLPRRGGSQCPDCKTNCIWYTGCWLNIVLFLKMLWFFWTLQVLLQRWCSTCHCVHTLTPRGNPERPESGIYLKIFEKTQNLMNNLYHSGAQSMKKAGKWTLRLIFDPLEFCNIRDHLKITWIFKELGLCWFRYTLLLWRSSSFSKQKY